MQAVIHDPDARERLTPVRILALAFACAGLALVLGSQLGPEADATAAGVALAWAAILIAVVIVQRPDPRTDAGRSVVRSSGGTALR